MQHNNPPYLPVESLPAPVSVQREGDELIKTSSPQRGLISKTWARRLQWEAWTLNRTISFINGHFTATLLLLTFPPRTSLVKDLSLQTESSLQGASNVAELFIGIMDVFNNEALW
ncbi:hypothetical protein MHYP_G00209140 [Metynnis hypsauchen]